MRYQFILIEFKDSLFILTLLIDGCELIIDFAGLNSGGGEDLTLLMYAAIKPNNYTSILVI